MPRSPLRAPGCLVRPLTASLVRALARQVADAALGERGVW